MALPVLINKHMKDIFENKLCDSGCGQPAKFFSKGTGRYRCMKSANSCPANKSKNSAAIKKAHAEGRVPGWNDLSKTHSLNRGWAKGQIAYTDKRIRAKYQDDLFQYGKKGPHKKILIKERGHICEKCNNSVWLGKKITLELEHVDGDSNNNVRENLKLLCPNCHSQTKTWRRAKKNYGNRNKKYSDEEILAAIKTSENIHQALNKLGLKWGSAQTIVSVMGKYQQGFMGS